MPKKMNVKFIEYGSEEWKEARCLRYKLLFETHGLPENILDDEYEKCSMHAAIVVDGVIVAYGRLTELGDASFVISQMVVSSNNQRAGLGSKILGFLLSKTSGNTVSLSARLTAVKFYSKFGFKVCSSEYFSKTTGVPHVKMKLA